MNIAVNRPIRRIPQMNEIIPVLFMALFIVSVVGLALCAVLKKILGSHAKKQDHDLDPKYVLAWQCGSALISLVSLHFGASINLSLLVYFMALIVFGIGAVAWFFYDTMKTDVSDEEPLESTGTDMDPTP